MTLPPKLLKLPLAWWSERAKLARLTRSAEVASDNLGKAYAEARAKNLRGDDVQEHTAEAWHEYTWATDALEDALHQRLILQAHRLRVPVPQRTKESTDWEESSLHTWRLTQEAGYALRRTIADEVEMRQRPWLNLASVVVSVLSLIVAIMALGLGR